MPYIKKEVRPIFEPELEQLGRVLQQERDPLKRAGQVTFVITELLLAAYPEKQYPLMALVDGILGTASKEYYRKRTAPYEDLKAIENGEICWSNELCSNCGGYAGGSNGTCLSCAIIGKD